MKGLLAIIAGLVKTFHQYWFGALVVTFLVVFGVNAVVAHLDRLSYTISIQKVAESRASRSIPPESGVSGRPGFR